MNLDRCTCDGCGKVAFAPHDDPAPRGWYYVCPPGWLNGNPHPVACSRKCAEVLRPKQFRGGKAARL